MSTNITSLHVERGRQMRSIIESDMVTRSLSFEASVESLASYLGIQVESVLLGVSIANDAEREVV